MADYRKNEIVSGLFITGALLVFGLFAFRVGDLDAFGLFRGRVVTCEAYFSDIKSLDVGAKVTVAGRRVGTVRALDIEDRPVTAEEMEKLLDAFGPQAFPNLQPGMLKSRIRVRFELEDPALRFDPATARVSLLKDGFLGRHFLAFYPGHWSETDAPPALAAMDEESGEIAVTESADLDQLISTINPAVRKVDELLEVLRSEILDEAGVQSAKTALAEIGQSLEALSALLDADDPQGLHALVLQPLNGILSDADGALAQIREGVVVPAEAMLAEGPGLVADARRALGGAHEMLEENRPMVASILGQLDDATRDLDQQLADMSGQVESLLGSLEGAVGETRPELAETMRRLRRTMWQAEMAARKVRANPAFLLFGDEEADLDQQPADHSEAWRAGRARPYGQRGESDGE